MFFDPKRAFSENREKTVAGKMGISKASFSSVFVRRCVRRACLHLLRLMRPLRLRALLILRADQQLPGLSGFL